MYVRLFLSIGTLVAPAKFKQRKITLCNPDENAMLGGNVRAY